MIEWVKLLPYARELFLTSCKAMDTEPKEQESLKKAIKKLYNKDGRKDERIAQVLIGAVPVDKIPTKEAIRGNRTSKDWEALKAAHQEARHRIDTGELNQDDLALKTIFETLDRFTCTIVVEVKAGLDPDDDLQEMKDMANIKAEVAIDWKQQYQYYRHIRKYLMEQKLLQNPDDRQARSVLDDLATFTTEDDIEEIILLISEIEPFADVPRGVALSEGFTQADWDLFNVSWEEACARAKAFSEIASEADGEPGVSIPVEEVMKITKKAHKSMGW